MKTTNKYRAAAQVIQQYKYCGLSPSLVSLSVSFYCYLFSLFIFICSCSWNLGCDCSFSCYLEQFASAWWCSCWPLLFTWGGYQFCIHMISFRLAELIPNKSCSGDGLCRWLGRSDLHGSHVKMLLVGLLFPVAERDASYLHPRLPPLPPRKYMHTVKCEKNNIMWKKTVCTVLGISSSGWGFEPGRLVEASIYEAHCSFLGVLHQLLVLALLGVAPPPVVSSEKTSASCPEC